MIKVYVTIWELEERYKSIWNIQTTYIELDYYYTIISHRIWSFCNIKIMVKLFILFMEESRKERVTNLSLVLEENTLRTGRYSAIKYCRRSDIQSRLKFVQMWSRTLPKSLSENILLVHEWHDYTHSNKSSK